MKTINWNERENVRKNKWERLGKIKKGESISRTRESERVNVGKQNHE